MTEFSLLPLFGPPCIGAFIGYLTNRIAIRMLFRPLTPWRILGIRVPMTPGVIPAKRHELAANIGRMVGEHLLTPRDIGAALSMEPFQEHLHGLVENRIDELMERDLGTILEVVPGRFRAYARVGLRTLKMEIKKGIGNHIASEAFARTVGTVVSEQVARYRDREVESLFSLQDRKGFYACFDRVLAELLSSPGLEAWLASALENRLRECVREGTKVGEWVPDALGGLIQDTVRSRTPDLLCGLADLLGEPMLRDRIVQGIVRAIDGFLMSLGPMAAMARGFIDPASLDERIRAYLDTHQEELKQWLLEPETQRQTARILEEQVLRLLDMEVADVLGKLSDRQQRDICRSLAAGLIAVLRDEKTVTALSALLAEGLEEMIDHGRLPLVELEKRLSPGPGEGELEAVLEREALALMRAPAAGRMIGRMVDQLMEELSGRRIGPLKRLVPAGVRRGMTGFIVLMANRMLLAEVPGLVRSLNLASLVREKVDSLDLLQLEGLLLSIMEEQFKYINLFGALLGFLLGLCNLVLFGLG